MPRLRLEVLAVAASRDYGLNPEQGQTTYALPTSPVPFGAGSTYKIFTAAALLANGMGIISPVPVYDSYTAQNFTGAGGGYTVQNATPNYPEGPITLQKALAISPNTTFVALEDRLGSVDPVVDMAYKLGLRRGLSVEPEQGGPSLRELVKQREQGSFTLGPTPTIPLELSNVAATLMSGGTWCPPTPIESITDRNGRSVPVPEPSCEQVMPEGLANTLVTGLSKDVVSGTASSAAKAAGWNRPMLGKTGTTQNFQSVAFVGATPQFAGATFLWSDGSDPQPICTGNPPRQCGSGHIFGADIAPTWFRTMKPLHQGLSVAPLPPTVPRYVDGE